MHLAAGGYHDLWMRKAQEFYDLLVAKKINPDGSPVSGGSSSTVEDLQSRVTDQDKRITDQDIRLTRQSVRITDINTRHTVAIEHIAEQEMPARSAWGTGPNGLR